MTNGVLGIFKLLSHKMITLEEARKIKGEHCPHNCHHGPMVKHEDTDNNNKSDGHDGSFDVSMNPHFPPTSLQCTM